MKSGAMILALAAALLAAGCDSSNPCSEEQGKVLCGYCDQDAVLSSSPHAGMCRYCASGENCSGDVCGDLSCVSGGGGGDCRTCACPQYSSCNSCGGTYCKNNLCSPAAWCCAGACDGCGCR